MTAMVAEDLAQIPMSPFLAASLERAANYAEEQAHREVTLEHVLLALTEDPEASVILRTSDIEIERLQSDVSNYLGNVDDRQNPNDARPVSTSQDLQHILVAAAEAAKQGQRREINGAILLAAIIGDGSSPAAHMLRAQGLTFEAVIAVLRGTSMPAEPAPGNDGGGAATQPASHSGQETMPAEAVDQAPAPRPVAVDEGTANVPAEDVLAAARARVDKRQLPDASAPVVSPSAEPQWEPVVEQASERFGSDNDLTSDDSLFEDEEISDEAMEGGAPVAPPPEAPQRRQAEPQTPLPAAQPQPAAASASQWAPPHAPGRADERAGQPPRLQRVPPPLPPDAGLKPPRSQAAPAPPSPAQQPRNTNGRPGPDGFPPNAAQMGGSSLPDPQRPQHVPPWVGETGQTRGPGQPPAAVPHPAQSGRPMARSTKIRVETGQMVENIPRKMKAGVSQLVEVRIARANVKALADGLQGGGAAYKHEAMITKAMSVKLRAPDGGFWVEAASPETQWIENVLGVMTDDFASWRWTVTPKASGQKKLQLVVSARTVGSDGLAAETALPDQIFDVRVGINYKKSTKRLAGWLAAAVFGGLLAQFGEAMFVMLKVSLTQLGII